jgi:hypothetical protein
MPANAGDRSLREIEFPPPLPPPVRCHLFAIDRILDERGPSGTVGSLFVIGWARRSPRSPPGGRVTDRSGDLFIAALLVGTEHCSVTLWISKPF